MSQKYRLLTLILSLIIALVSCMKNVTDEQGMVTTDAPISTTDQVITATATENQFPRPPVPTISLTDEINLVEILNLNNCTLPCYMGIIPGRTKVDDAVLMLESAGAVYLGQTTNDNTTRAGYDIQFDDPSIESTTSSYDKKQRIFNSIGLISVNGVVQQIYIWILSRGLSTKFQDYWSKYTPKGVFLQIGMPDKIYSGTHGGLALVYEHLGIINIYGTFLKDRQLCPQNETAYFDRRFEITNKDSPIEILSENEKALKSREIWLPVEEILGISIQEFYDQVITNDSVCFDIN